jgi:hypothetical protein
MKKTMGTRSVCTACPLSPKYVLESPAAHTISFVAQPGNTCEHIFRFIRIEPWKSANRGGYLKQLLISDWLEPSSVSIRLGRRQLLSWGRPCTFGASLTKRCSYFTEMNLQENKGRCKSIASYLRIVSASHKTKARRFFRSRNTNEVRESAFIYNVRGFLVRGDGVMGCNFI